MASSEMVTDFPSASALESYCMMLQERVGKLEDAVVQLQPRFTPPSTFVAVNLSKAWFVRMYLRSWPRDLKTQRTLCDEFFEDLRYICHIDGNDQSATLVLCGFVEAPLGSFSLPIQHSYDVVEGVFTSDIHLITSEAIGAAFERSWSTYILHLEEPHNFITRLPTDQCPPLVDAIHVVNGSSAHQFEFNQRDELWGVGLDMPEKSVVVGDLVKSGVSNELFDNPRFHEEFPDFFWKKLND